jgi:hypothetical protein
LAVRSERSFRTLIAAEPALVTFAGRAGFSGAGIEHWACRNKQLQTHKNVQLNDAGMDLILVSHYIDPAPLRANNYEEFIERRRRALMSLISQVMGKAIVVTGEAVADDEVDEEDAAA